MKDSAKLLAAQRHVREALATFAQANAQGQVAPGVYFATVRHQHGCSLAAGLGACDCSPTVTEPKRLPAPDEN